MDTVTILRVLWHRRLLVVVVALVALLAGTAVAYRISFPPKLESRTYEVGVATSRILVDTPSSQVVEVAPKGSDALGTRAGLIASLMVDGSVKAAIAKRAGLKPGQFDATSDSATADSIATAPPKPRGYLLSTHVLTSTSGDALPIIEIQTQAADAGEASRLAQAAVLGLDDYLSSKAAQQRVPGAKRLQVSGLGTPQARDVRRGPRRLFALMAAIVVFSVGCGVIVALSRLARAWQAASDDDDAPDRAGALHAVPDRNGEVVDVATLPAVTTASSSRSTSTATRADRVREAPLP
jgi:hypothetical protein